MLALECSTDGAPIRTMVDASREGIHSASARRRFAEINSDTRMGKIAVMGGSRFNRIMAIILLKASGRTNIRFFDSKNEAKV